MKNNILLPDGILVGHDTIKNKTGVTVILAPEGAVGGVSVQGCAPGTRETDLLAPTKAVEKVHAVVFSGGSAFGLSAADGVMLYCKENNIGFEVAEVKVPLVSAAVIFDLHDTSYTFPDAKAGYRACKNANNEDIKFGSIGAGTGATVGKMLGAACSQKGGIGAATVLAGNAFVTAISVVNALGDIMDPSSGQIVAGLHDGEGNFINTANMILNGAASLQAGTNTTLSCILTNVNLTKLQANKLAAIAHDAYAKTISPVHTDYDGDTIFCLSKGSETMDFTALSVMAVKAVSDSILNAVKGK